MDQDALRKRYSRHSDDRLLTIISVKRHEYEKVALGVAEQTLRERGLHFLFEPSAVTFSKDEIEALREEFEAELSGMPFPYGAEHE